MTLTERKHNPAVTAMLAQTLTEKEMAKAAGGSYNWKLLVLCMELGIHDMVPTGEYTYGSFCGDPYRYPVLMCSRCGKRGTGNGERIYY